ncbi:hypothetical protein JSO61_003535 [Riemerella anatipestifer]|uniref:hypothetical protein n=1 Tax=Bergeyella anatis TaxID=3113737 RepID=UPI002E17EE73|nr:hypothetical protein [Bergeyella sp. RCAD1439]
MEIVSLNKNTYKSIFKTFTNVFCSIDFADLNAHFFEEIRYLAFVENGKYKAGLILGKKDSTLYAPTKAPFSGFNKINDTSLESLDKILPLLQDYAKEQTLDISITLPPIIYDNDFYNHCISAFFRSEFQAKNVDLNFHLDVKKLQKDYKNLIPRAGRKNLNNGLKSPKIELLSSNDKDFIEKVYSIIKTNRDFKGYPLRMTLEQILNTIEIIKADFFILKVDNEAVAAAQVFHVAEGVVQVIYWGDLPHFETLRPMNVLAYKILKYYADFGINVIDIGPSSENSIPSYGLCNFKSNIGCDTSLKYQFILRSNYPSKEK